MSLHRCSRSYGLTVIEVLTSIIVATIGVAGVMIMIPFAVGQAEQGVDLEIATNLAQNASAEFELHGFANTSTWSPTVPVDHNASTARSYVIDPIGVGAREVNGEVDVNGDFDPGRFPFIWENLENQILALSGGSYFGDGIQSLDKTILVQRKSIASNTSTSFQRFELARSLFAWNEDLVFSLGPSDLGPPQQIYDVDGATNIRRQAEKEMSYMVVVAPSDISTIPALAAYPTSSTAPRTPDVGNSDSVFEFRNSVVAFRRRVPPITINLDSGIPQGYDRMYQVVHPAGSSYPPTLPNRIAYGGGDLKITDQTGDAALATSNLRSTQRPEVRRGDWIALTNVIFDQNKQRFVRRLDFYQVIDAAYDDVTAPVGWLVTLQGPDFDFGFSYTGSTPDATQNYSAFGDYCARVETVALSTVYTPSKTYAIHLPDAWSVVERTFRPPSN